MVPTNENDNAGEGFANLPGGAGGATAATSMRRDDQADYSSEVRQAEYVHNGMAFTDWLNSKLGLVANPSITLGTKQAQVVRLHPDGRLECILTGTEDGGATQFVAFEGQYLDQFVRKIGALGL